MQWRILSHRESVGQYYTAAGGVRHITVKVETRLFQIELLVNHIHFIDIYHMRLMWVRNERRIEP